MTENQNIEFNICRENLAKTAGDTGGAVREVICKITVDTSFSVREQRINLTHETLGAYLGSTIPREILEEIAEKIIDNLEELKRLN